MVAAKTTADLIADVISGAQLHAEAGVILDGRVSNADVLTWASKLLSTSVASVLIGTRSERWAWQDTDTPIVAGQALYRVPSRALAAGVGQVLYVVGERELELSPVGTYERAQRSETAVDGDAPYAYTYEADRLVLVPTPRASTGSLRVRYPRQPARLVEVSACRTVASTTATTITLTAAASPWVTGAVLDVTRGSTHGDVLAADLTATLIAGSVVTVAAVPSEVAAGDVVSLAGLGCVIPLPEVVYHYLVDVVTLEVQRRIGDDPSAIADATQAAMARRAEVRDLLEPRGRGRPRVPVRHTSPLRQRWSRW